MSVSNANLAPPAKPLGDRLSDRIDSTLLVYLRVVVGVAIYTWAGSFLSENKYDTVFLQARFQFKYSGFEWVQLWPGEGIYWHFVITKIASIGLIVGLLTRISAAVLSGSITYVLLVERAIYVNHYYLLACVAGLLMFLPAGRRYSIDSLVGIERPSTTWWRWQLWLVRFQLGIPYVFGAIAKLHTDWFRGQPADLILRQKIVPGVGPLNELPLAVETMSYGGFLFDLLIIPMLLIRQTRWVGVVLATCFHALNAWILNIGVFPWFMLATLVVFFPINTLRDRLDSILGRSTSAGPEMELQSEGPSRLTRAGFAVAIVYVFVQLILPFRPWVYPGDANWNDRGHRYAWRMMLHDKRALTHFLLIDRAAGESIVLPSTQVVTGYQALRADHHPALIRQTAEHLQATARNQFGVQDCEIYCLALVTLNGRKPTPLIDPNVDLTQVRTGWWTDSWVTASPGEFLKEPWTVDRERWWKEVSLPAPFRKLLQGRTPAGLQRYLDRSAAANSNLNGASRHND